MKYLLTLLLLCIVCHKVTSTCGMPSNMSRGQLIKSIFGEYYAVQFQSGTFYNTTKARCAMLFLAESQYLSMNVVGTSLFNVKCEMLERKASDTEEKQGVLIKQEGSSYYEKFENFVKASESILHVETKNDKPGIVCFPRPTGNYRIRLNHVGGKPRCNNHSPSIPFGCSWTSDHRPNDIHLVYDFRGDIVVDMAEFTEFEGDGKTTSYVATKKCFYLIQNTIYSFWYSSDYSNRAENENSGSLSFEFFVQLCGF